jgi:hypothetical protein
MSSGVLRVSGVLYCRPGYLRRVAEGMASDTRADVYPLWVDPVRALVQCGRRNVFLARGCVMVTSSATPPDK